ncbi:MAG: hypothetical protein AAGF14_08670 [Pseudomonadota bacterium]
MGEVPHTAEMAAVVGSITHLGDADVDRHVCTGSHGGVAVGKYAAFRRVRSLICHDAGIGKDEAGIRALAFLDIVGLAAAAVDHRTARIGDADDMIARGVISRTNETAVQSGVRAGMTCEEAFGVFQHHAPMPKPAERAAPETFRRIAIAVSSGAQVHALDSASSITEEDAGRVVVTGSHGGLPGAAPAKAIKAEVRFAAFNDAGIGINDAGIARLAALEDIGVAAVTVGCESARIGDGLSTYETGVISHMNDHARALGARLDAPLRDVVDQLLEGKT